MMKKLPKVTQPITQPREGSGSASIMAMIVCITIITFVFLITNK